MIYGERSQGGGRRVKFSAYITAVFIGLILFSPSELRAVYSTGQTEKLTDPDEIRARFEQGEEKVRVIVNLAEPTQLRTGTVWDARNSLKILQAEVKKRQEKVLQKLDKTAYKLRHRFENQAGFSAEVAPGILQKLLNDPDVESVEPVYILKPHLAQGIDLMNALSTRLLYNGQDVSIAICDTGIDYTHPMLGGGGFPNSKVLDGNDFGDNDPDPMPVGEAHGTSCAGIAAGDLSGVGDYIGGVAHNAKLYALKITPGGTGSASSDDMVAAWNWCISHKNDDPNNPILVISTSFGGDRFLGTCDSAVPSMTTAANNAVSAGITVLVSAGNEGYCDALAWPACISSVISVGAVYDADIGRYPELGYVGCILSESCAGYTVSCPCPEKCYVDETTAADQVTTYSNTSILLDLFAPSNNAYTTDIVGSEGYTSGDYYSAFGGTSAACPYAAGAVACLQSAAKAILGSYLTPQQVRDTLVLTGNNVTDPKASITKPRINLGWAIASLTGVPPIAFDDTITIATGTEQIIILQAGDPDGGKPDPPAALTYIIESLPEYGTLKDPCEVIITDSNLPYSLPDYGNEVTYTPDYNCFTGIDSFTFDVNDGGQDPNGGVSNTATITLNVEEQPVIIFSTDFEGGLPSGWTIVDGGGTSDTWMSENPQGWSNPNWTGTFIIADSDLTGKKYMDEELITGSIDCTELSDVTLKFKHHFYWYILGRDEKGDVDVRVDGGSWQNAAHYEDADASGQVILDLSQYGADGDPNVQVRWHYYNARDDWYWGIDDVEITGVSGLEYPAGDFEPDCDVDLFDYSAFASAWQSNPNDINWNEIYDLLIFSSNWLYGKMR
jgi:subtilisin family serine protease